MHTNRFRSASRHAYFIRPDGSVPGSGAEIGPPVGYTGAPVGVIAGEGIDAGLVASVPEGVIISIRGTTPPFEGAPPLKVIKDWAQNTGALLTAAGGHPPGFPGKIHFGFYQSFSKLWTELQPVVKAQVTAHPKKAIFVTGHSKGGAVCPLIAWRLHKDFGDTHSIKVRTFAAPRCGDGAFALAYNAAVPDHVRYEFDDDIVPHLPVATALASAIGFSAPAAGFISMIDPGYGEIGELGYIKANGTISGATTGLEASRFASLTSLLVSGLGPATIVACHGISKSTDGYVKAQYPN